MVLFIEIVEYFEKIKKLMEVLSFSGKNDLSFIGFMYTVFYDFIEIQIDFLILAIVSLSLLLISDFISVDL